MTLALILAIFAIIALAFAFRHEANRRREAELRLRAADARCAEDTEVRRRFVPVAAHELRSPISVILGYQELLADGLYGELDEKGAEGLARVRRSAEQLLRLVDGIVELASANSVRTLELAPVDLDEALSEALDSSAAYGQAYGVRLEPRREGPLPTVTLDRDRTIRALDMALAAAIKASPGRALPVTATPTENGLLLRIAGTALEAERDDASVGAGQAPLIHTGAGLRLAIARSALQPDGGTLVLTELSDGITVELRVEGVRPAPIDDDAAAR